MPAQQGFWLDEESSEMSAGKESCECHQHRSIRRIQRRAADLAPHDRHFLAQHDNLDGGIGVTAADQSDELKDTAERPVEERKGHCRMFAVSEFGRQSPVRGPRMAFSAPLR